MEQPISDDGSISVGDTMRYIREGHNDIFKVTRILHSGSLFSDIGVELWDQRKIEISEKFL